MPSIWPPNGFEEMILGLRATLKLSKNEGKSILSFFLPLEVVVSSERIRWNRYCCWLVMMIISKRASGAIYRLSTISRFTLRRGSSCGWEQPVNWRTSCGVKRWFWDPWMLVSYSLFGEKREASATMIIRFELKLVHGKLDKFSLKCFLTF